MNASLSWIKAYVPDLQAGYQEFRDAMTLSGTKVEGFTQFDKDLDKIVIGQIDKIEKHPDADKLLICQVNLGDENVQIVTGASNVFEGAKVPVVKDGGKVAGGHDGKMTEGGITIKAGKLRGIDSYGMMCSIEELGSTREMYPDAAENGIYILPDDAVVGADAIEYLGLHDANYEFEITSNRVDCYSVLGIAREAAATFRLPFHGVEPKIEKTIEDIHDYLEVEVADPDLCPRYTCMMVKNIRLAPSPAWLQRRLASNGIRPINNVVDITNYVMEEFGQPMHAFDYDTIHGHKIIVKRANDGDLFVTLDGQERKLDKDILMINDAERPIGIAGIMGGEDSKITDDVQTLVFESACFDGTNNRLSAKRLGMRTDASGKYEKGLDPNNALPALIRACQLIEELDAGDVIGGAIDIYPEPVKEKQILFDPERINAYLGTDIDEETQLSYFPALEIKYDPATKMLTIPTFRQDLLRGADIAEEVARFYGYDNIPSTLPDSEEMSGRLSHGFVVQNKIRETMRAYGYSEAMTFSFESPKVFDKLHLAADDPHRNVVTISNPLGEDYSIMRTSLINGMLTSLAINFNRRNKSAALYELSNIYLPKALPLTELPDERMTLCFGFYGDGDFFDLKGTMEEVLTHLGLRMPRDYVADASLPFLHPGRQAKVMVKGGREQIGYLGEVHPQVSKAYGMNGKVYIAQVDVQTLYDYANFDKKYKEIPKYPAVTRDLSLVMDKEIPAGEIENVISKCGGKLLESCSLFDIYEGERIGENKKSLAYNMVFRANDRTLEDKDVNPIIDKIIAKLKEKNIELRS
ncbi:MAG: phenylalanine--tRNA ligase subunit beta [Lachnospiraceae bacterium]|nr:phenylalanine--tRNA ligase subunit beta [Lachnospiraceae bacterium]